MHSVCQAYDYKDIAEMFNGIAHKLASLGLEKLRGLKWGFNCDPDVDKKIKKLTTFSDVLRRYNKAIALGYSPCLTDSDLQSLIEKIKSIVGNSCKELCNFVSVDESGVESWALNNPKCQSHEDWEKWVYYVCEKIELEIFAKYVKNNLSLAINQQKQQLKVTNLQIESNKLKRQTVDVEVNIQEETCDIVFDVMQKRISCNVILAATAYKQACDLGLKITKSTTQCQIDFNIIKTEVPGCKLSLQLYKRLTECNLSFGIIKEVYKSGLSLTVDKRKKDCKVQMVSPTRKYCLKNLSMGNISYLKKFDLSPTITIDSLLKNYDK